MNSRNMFGTLRRTMSAIAAALALGAGAAQAAPITVPNHSFQNPAVGAPPDDWGYYVSDGGGNPYLPDWSYATWANIRVLNSDGSLAVTGGDGSQYLEMLTWADSNSRSINQTLADTIQAGTYTLTVATGYGTYIYYPKPWAAFSLRAWDGASFTDLGTTTVDLPQRYNDWRYGGPNPQADKVLDDFTLTVVVPADSPHIGKPLDIRLFTTNNDVYQDSVAFDNVRLDFVPETGAITVKNYSFESPSAAGYSSGVRNVVGSLTDWATHSWAWTDYVVRPGEGIDLSGVTGAQFLMLDPGTDSFEANNWSLVYQNTGADFAAGTYTLTVDVGYAQGWLDQGQNAGFSLQLVAVDGNGTWTGIGATTISAATLAAHDGSLATYTHTLNVTGNEPWIGQDVLIFLNADSPADRGAPAEDLQNVSLDNVRLDFTPQPPGISIERSGNNLLLTWSGGTLEATADLAAGPWTAVPDATSPWSFVPAVQKSFYRVGAPGYDRPAQISGGSVTVDGDLSDWSSESFVPVDKVYDTSGSSEAALNADVAEAYYAARWVGDKVYVAVKVRDLNHSFQPEYLDWNAQDGVEIYLHTTGTGPTDYSADQAAAQQYEVGIKQGTIDAVWTGIGYKNAVPAWAGFQAAGRVDGQWLHYEAALTPFGQFSLQNGTQSISMLSVGQVIGLDVVVTGHNGSAYAGMKSENLKTGKSVDYTKIGRHLLTD